MLAMEPCVFPGNCFEIRHFVILKFCRFSLASPFFLGYHQAAIIYLLSSTACWPPHESFGRALVGARFFRSYPLKTGRPKVDLEFPALTFACFVPEHIGKRALVPAQALSYPPEMGISYLHRVRCIFRLSIGAGRRVSQYRQGLVQ